MTLEQVGILIAIVTGLGSLFTAVYLAGVKIAKLELKVDTIWDFLMRRAMADAVNRGHADMNSPVVVREESKQLLAHLAGELKKWYRESWHKLDDSALLLEIEKRYGENIVNTVCIPHQLSQGVCLLIAAAVAKEGYVAVTGGTVTTTIVSQTPPEQTEKG